MKLLFCIFVFGLLCFGVNGATLSKLIFDDSYSENGVFSASRTTIRDRSGSTSNYGDWTMRGNYTWVTNSTHVHLRFNGSTTEQGITLNNAPAQLPPSFSVSIDYRMLATEKSAALLIFGEIPDFNHPCAQASAGIFHDFDTITAFFRLKDPTTGTVYCREYVVSTEPGPPRFVTLSITHKTMILYYGTNSIDVVTTTAPVDWSFTRMSLFPTADTRSPFNGMVYGFELVDYARSEDEHLNLWATTLIPPKVEPPARFTVLQGRSVTIPVLSYVSHPRGMATTVRLARMSPDFMRCYTLFNGSDLDSPVYVQPETDAQKAVLKGAIRAYAHGQFEDCRTGDFHVVVEAFSTTAVGARAATSRLVWAPLVLQMVDSTPPQALSAVLSMPGNVQNVELPFVEVVTGPTVPIDRYTLTAIPSDPTVTMSVAYAAAPRVVVAIGPGLLPLHLTRMDALYISHTPTPVASGDVAPMASWDTLMANITYSMTVRASNGLVSAPGVINVRVRTWLTPDSTVLMATKPSAVTRVALDLPALPPTAALYVEPEEPAPEEPAPEEPAPEEPDTEEPGSDGEADGEGAGADEGEGGGDGPGAAEDGEKPAGEEGGDGEGGGESGDDAGGEGGDAPADTSADTPSGSSDEGSGSGGGSGGASSGEDGAEAGASNVQATAATRRSARSTRLTRNKATSRLSVAKVLPRARKALFNTITTSPTALRELAAMREFTALRELAAMRAQLPEGALKAVLAPPVAHAAAVAPQGVVPSSLRPWKADMVLVTAPTVGVLGINDTAATYLNTTTSAFVARVPAEWSTLITGATPRTTHNVTVFSTWSYYLVDRATNLPLTPLLVGTAVVDRVNEPPVIHISPQLRALDVKVPVYFNITLTDPDPEGFADSVFDVDVSASSIWWDFVLDDTRRTKTTNYKAAIGRLMFTAPGREIGDLLYNMRAICATYNDDDVTAKITLVERTTLGAATAVATIPLIPKRMQRWEDPTDPDPENPDGEEGPGVLDDLPSISLLDLLLSFFLQYVLGPVLGLIALWLLCCRFRVYRLLCRKKKKKDPKALAMETIMAICDKSGQSFAVKSAGDEEEAEDRREVLKLQKLELQAKIRALHAKFGAMVNEEDAEALHSSDEDGLEQMASKYAGTSMYLPGWSPSKATVLAPRAHAPILEGVEEEGVHSPALEAPIPLPLPLSLPASASAPRATRTNVDDVDDSLGGGPLITPPRPATASAFASPRKQTPASASFSPATTPRPQRNVPPVRAARSFGGPDTAALAVAPALPPRNGLRAQSTPTPLSSLALAADTVVVGSVPPPAALSASSANILAKSPFAKHRFGAVGADDLDSAPFSAQHDDYDDLPAPEHVSIPMVTDSIVFPSGALSPHVPRPNAMLPPYAPASPSMRPMLRPSLHQRAGRTLDSRPAPALPLPASASPAADSDDDAVFSPAAVVEDAGDSDDVLSACVTLESVVVDVVHQTPPRTRPTLDVGSPDSVLSDPGMPAHRPVRQGPPPAVPMTPQVVRRHGAFSNTSVPRAPMTVQAPMRSHSCMDAPRASPPPPRALAASNAPAAPLSTSPMARAHTFTFAPTPPASAAALVVHPPTPTTETATPTASEPAPFTSYEKEAPPPAYADPVESTTASSARGSLAYVPVAVDFNWMALEPAAANAAAEEASALAGTPAQQEQEVSAVCVNLEAAFTAQKKGDPDADAAVDLDSPVARVAALLQAQEKREGKRVGGGGSDSEDSDDDGFFDHARGRRVDALDGLAAFLPASMAQLPTPPRSTPPSPCHSPASSSSSSSSSAFASAASSSPEQTGPHSPTLGLDADALTPFPSLAPTEVYSRAASEVDAAVSPAAPISTSAIMTVSGAAPSDSATPAKGGQGAGNTANGSGNGNGCGSGSGSGSGGGGNNGRGGSRDRDGGSANRGSGSGSGSGSGAPGGNGGNGGRRGFQLGSGGDDDNNNGNGNGSGGSESSPESPTTCDHPDCILNSRNGRVQCLRALVNDPSAPEWARNLAPDGHSWASTRITEEDDREREIVARAGRGEPLTPEEVALLRDRVEAMNKQLEAKKKRLEEAKKREGKRGNAKRGFHMS